MLDLGSFKHLDHFSHIIADAREGFFLLACIGLSRWADIFSIVFSLPLIFFLVAALSHEEELALVDLEVRILNQASSMISLIKEHLELIIILLCIHEESLHLPLNSIVTLVRGNFFKLARRSSNLVWIQRSGLIFFETL